MEPKENVCIVCGGSDFVQQSGYYFCSECSTQSQNLRERCVETSFADQTNLTLRTKTIATGSAGIGVGQATPSLATSGTRAIKAAAAKAKAGSEDKDSTAAAAAAADAAVDKSSDLRSSIEAYNCILAGLTRQLIEGQKIANCDQFQQTVKHLWLGYLVKMQVLNKEDLPKMFATYKQVDAFCFYKHEIKSKRKPKLPVDDVDDDDNDDEYNDDDGYGDDDDDGNDDHSGSEATESKGPSKTKRKKPMNPKTPKKQKKRKKEEKISQDEEKSTPRMKFTKFGNKVLLSRMTRKHMLKIHATNRLDKCHDRSHLIGVQNLCRGMEELNYPSKLNAFLLLAVHLNLNSQGSYDGGNNWTVLPCDLMNPEILGHGDSTWQRLLVSEGLSVVSMESNRSERERPNYSWQRIRGGELARLLGIEWLPRPRDLSAICRRFCYELNLPDFIADTASLFLQRSHPRDVSKLRVGRSLPNHEGRVMGYIIFTLKYFFGLDGCTEVQNSLIAEQLNRQRSSNGSQAKFEGESKYFSWQEWQRHLDQRHAHLAKKVYLPTNPVNRDSMDTMPAYAKFIENKKARRGVLAPTKVMRKYVHLQSVLRELEKFHRYYANEDEDDSIAPPTTDEHCLTPLRSFADNGCDFSGQRYASTYHQGNGAEMEEENRPRLLFQPTSVWCVKGKRSRKRRLVSIKVLSDSETESMAVRDSTQCHTLSCNRFLEKPVEMQVLQWREAERSKRSAKTCNKREVVENDQLEEASELPGSPTDGTPPPSTHKLLLKMLSKEPPRIYWLRLENTADMQEDQWNAMHASYPASYRWLLDVCARLIGHTTRELMSVCAQVEVYEIYVRRDVFPARETRQKREFNEKTDNADLINYLIRKTRSNWDFVNA